MTRENFEAFRGHTDGRGGVSHTPARRRRIGGRRATRLRAVSVVICCALALQPSLAAPSRARAASHARAAGRTDGSLTMLAQTLFSTANGVGAGLRTLLNSSTEARGTSAASGDFAEPEPAAAVVFLAAPAGLSVDATSNSQVSLSWAAVAGAVAYRIERSQNVLSPYSFVGETYANGFQDAGLERGSTHLYRVRAVDGSGAQSPPSAVIMATAITFLDDSLVRYVTTIKAGHVNDLRLAVGGVRRAAGLPAATWQETVSSGVVVRAEQVRELRARLDEALAALGLPTPPYTDPTLGTGSNGTQVKREYFNELRERSKAGAGVTGSGLTAYDFASARLDHSNRAGSLGVDSLSRNFNWSLPIVSLPGRAGLDLSLSLTYNSLVWTRSGDYVLFDGDWGWPAPGFRLGFPVVQGKFFDTRAQKNAYLLVTPSGARVSLRQTAVAGVYEPGDSSYLRLTENADGSLTLLAPGGTRMTYWSLGGAFKCVRVKERNGNFIDAAYNVYGNLETVTDTLGRTLSFVYHGDGLLKEITQTWRREVEGSAQPLTETHRWARFYFDEKVVRTNFAGLTVFGPANGQTFRALTKVKLADDSSYTFGYSTWAQVNQVAAYAPDNRLLTYVSLDLPVDETQPQTDCPRPTGRRDWAAYWNGDEDGVGAAAEEAVSSYSVTPGATWHDPETGAQQTGTLAQMTAPGGVVYREYSHASGWDAGLTRLGEIWSGGVRKKWTSTVWKQDEEALGYVQNPRVAETNVYDPNDDGTVRNRRRTQISYTSFGLPEDVREFDADATTVLRRSHTEYVPGSASDGGVYVNRRIIGLPSRREVYGREGGQEKLFSKTTLEYDLAGEFLVAPEGSPASVTQHDGAEFGLGFNTRGNVCRTRRWDVTDADNEAKSVASEVGYSTLGAVVFSRDALGHRTNLSYVDSDGGARLAYPTTVTDPGGFTASTSFNYDLGVATRSRTPLPNVTTNQPGPEEVRFYDEAGRVLKVRREPDGAYTRWEYGASGLYARQWSIVDAGQPETSVMSVTDGAGRVRGAIWESPGGAGGYSAQRFAYDEAGRQVRQYAPIRVSADASDISNVASWQPAGEDAPSEGGAGWVYASTEFDWKGRPVLVTGAGGAGATNEFRHDGCGCAGREVTLSRDETGRRQKITRDILGRVVEAQDLEVLDKSLPLTDAGGVYRTVQSVYNALDQTTETQTFAGDAESDSSKILKLINVYDGHARLRSSHAPGQAAGGSTVYAYRADDTLESITDARGVKVVYGHNSRHLVESVNYDLTGVLPGQEVVQSPGVAYTFDAAGNRLSMVSAAGAGGSVTYAYDMYSRLAAEARQFPGLSGLYKLAYEYTLSGQLKSLTDQTAPSSPVGFAYEFDAAGRVKGVTSTGMGATTPLASNAQYRATGALKHVEYGDTTAVNLSYNVRGWMSGYALGGARDATTGAARDEGGDFQYHADGRLKYVTDRLSRSEGTGLLDRAYAFDLVGRLKEAYSGADARAFAADATPGSLEAPYRHSFSFDVWDNQRDRTGHYWGTEDSFPAGFDPATGRDPSASYDADGRLLTHNEASPNGLPYQPLRFKFDAAGRRAQTTQTTSRQMSFPSHPVWTTAVTSTDSFDGDGLAVMLVKTTQRNSNPPSSSVTYQLRSSLLGGLLIAEYNSAGARQSFYAYAGGETLAVVHGAHTASPALRWQHANPLTGDMRETDDAGRVMSETRLDPSGVDVGRAGPPSEDDQGDSGDGGISQSQMSAMAAQLVPGFGGGFRCALNDLYMDCGNVGLLATGAGASASGPYGFHISGVGYDPSPGHLPPDYAPEFLDWVFRKQSEIKSIEHVDRYVASEGNLASTELGLEWWTELAAAGQACVSGLMGAVPKGMRGAALTAIPQLMLKGHEKNLTAEQMAYVIGTVQHESLFGTPIRGGGSWMFEQGSRSYFNQYDGRMGNTSLGDGYKYRGRGYVQITGLSNYANWSRRLGVDLVNNPDLAVKPEIAAEIAVSGMKDGAFRKDGRGVFSLERFFNDVGSDFLNARRIINGYVPKQALAVRKYAMGYSDVLKNNHCME